MSKRLHGRIALITGASRGIGKAVAEAYGREGAHVIAVARSNPALEELDDRIKAAGGSATLVPMDLCDFDAIDQMAAGIFERWGRLDILVGNAAILGDLAPVAHMVPAQWQQIFELNVTANYRLIRAFDPLLRQSEAGRAIFLTSGITRNIRPYWGVYGASKAALENIVLSYAAEMQNTQVRVNLVNPGPTRTGLRHAAFPGEDANALPPPEHVAETMIEAAMREFDGNGLWIAADAPSPSLNSSPPGSDQLH